MSTEYWGLSLDDMAEAIWIDIDSDAIGAHYIAFEGNREAARQKIIDAFTRLIDRHLYFANSYGSRCQEGNDNA